MVNTDPGKTFLNSYVDRSSAVKPEDFPYPEENIRTIRDTKDGRWPTDFRKIALGQVDQTIASEERERNYL